MVSFASDGAAEPPQGPLPSLSSFPASEESDLAHTVGSNLRRIRTERSLSLQALARSSQVSRAMLSQIELGRSTPTIGVLWKVALALDVPISTFLQHAQAGTTTLIPARGAKYLASPDGAFSSRALFPVDAPRRVEFYELRLAARGVEHAHAHQPGTVENLVVAEGAVEIVVDRERHVLGAGDAILFQADVPHTYRNTADAPAVIYLVMTYAETVG